MLNQSQQELEPQNLNWQWTDQAGNAVLPHVSVSGKMLSQKEINTLVAHLGSIRSSKRLNAERQLQGLDCNTILSIVSLVRKSKRRTIKTLPIAFGILLLPSIFNWVFHAHFSLTTWVTTPPMMLLSYLALRKSHKTSVTSLARFDNVESTDELACALDIPDKDVQQVVRPALIQLLPRLKSSDSRLLTEVGRQSLRHFLNTAVNLGKDTQRATREVDNQLAVEMLSALKQVGDASFIEVVSMLADPNNERESRAVFEAASECLPYLQELVMKQAASAHLLRASQAGSAGEASTLLKPVCTSQKLHETELLRGVGD